MFPNVFFFVASLFLRFSQRLLGYGHMFVCVCVCAYFRTYCISTNYFNFLSNFFSFIFFCSSMHCCRLWWKLARRRDIANFWHHHEQWTTIHARTQPNSSKLHISAVHVSRLHTFIMIQKYNLYYVRLLPLNFLAFSLACMCIYYMRMGMRLN